MLGAAIREKPIIYSPIIKRTLYRTHTQLTPRRPVLRRDGGRRQACHRYRLSAFRYGLSVRHRAGGGRGGACENRRRRGATRRDLCGDETVEHPPRTGEGGGGVSAQQRQPRAGLHRFVSDALSERVRGA